MNGLAIGLAGAGFVSVIVAWVSYLATIPKGTVPVRPVGAIAMQVGGALLGAAAIIVTVLRGSSVSITSLALGGFAITMGAFFLFLLSQRKTPVGDIRVKVGDKLLPFTAMTSNGESFSSDELADRRILFKFFRGGW